MAGKTRVSDSGSGANGKPVSQQMDMFASRVVPGAPDWPGPAEEDAQEALLGLMTRLILEHAAGDSSANNGGGGHDRWDKICAHHLERKAILYVRQSSPHQVLHYRESGGVCNTPCGIWLTALGFAEIEVIDDDLGRSAAGGVQRAGFERGWWPRSASARSARSALGKSRVSARNSRDWQQLIEMCRVVDTVLVDQADDLRAQARQRPTAVGAQGKSPTSTSLIFCASAQLAARYEKARRGEPVVAAPVGFVKAGDRFEQAIRIGACKPRSRWSSTGSRNLEARDRRCSGSMSITSTCQRSRRTVIRPGGVRARHSPQNGREPGLRRQPMSHSVARPWRQDTVAKGVGVKIRRKAPAPTGLRCSPATTRAM